MKKNNGISRIKLVIIIVAIILLFSFIFLHFSTDMSQYVSIFFKTIIGEINLNEEIATNEILLGITDVKGEGITINILDGADLIHQEDLIILIDELKNAGAEAISINGQRITNMSYLYCDGSVILLDNKKIGNPFTIKVIGNSETIYGAITRNKGYISTLENDGIEITIEKSANVEITKTNNTQLLNYNQNKSKISSLKESNGLIGKEDVKGKGVQIIINETKAKLTALSFLQIINDLNSAGAKAISVNGNRVTNSTDVMDISSKYVLINSIPIQAPYLIEAIGPQDKILEILDYKNSYINKIREKGNEVNIYTYPFVNILKYNNTRDTDKMSLKYVQYVEKN